VISNQLSFLIKKCFKPQKKIAAETQNLEEFSEKLSKQHIF